VKKLPRSVFISSTIALCLTCHILDDSFYIWMGNDQYGKSLLRDLISYVFGEYYDFMKPNYLTAKNLSNHDEELYDKKGIRICILSNPIVNAKTGKVDANISFLKQITSLDDQRIRAPYGVRSLIYKPKYKFIIQTNNYINFPDNDHDITKKIRNITFPYSFRKEDEINVNDPMQKPCDEGLKELIKQKKYILAFLSILIDEYNDLRSKNFKLDTPIEFTEMKNDYMAENDPVQDFIDNYLIKTKSEKDFIKSSDMYEYFKKQMMEKSNGISIVTFKEIMTRKKILWKRTNNSRIYYNVKLKQVNDIDIIDV
jgi:phage/plasmid-associated DNA primase